MNRLVIVPDATLEAAGLALKLRLAAIAGEIDATNIPPFMGPHALRCLTWAAAENTDSEILLWAREKNGYAVAWASGTPREDVEGRGRADQMEGMIARIFETHRSESEGAHDLQAADWTNLERLRGATIDAMAASPVILFESCVAVLSRVRYRGKTANESTATAPAESASLLARLIEDRLIRVTLGMESS